MLFNLLGVFTIAVSFVDAGWPGNPQCYPAPQVYPAEAPGVLNPLGKGQDPAPVRWYNASLGQNVYLFPDVNFGSLVYLRVSPDLSEVQYNPDNLHTVFQFGTDIATEAPDLSQLPDGRWVMYISAVQINTIFVIESDTEDPLGPWSQYPNVQHDGQQIQGYDAHHLNLPNGDRYLTWSTSYHAPPSVSIIKLQNSSHAVPGTPLSAIVVPSEYYEMNQIPAGNYSYDGHTCCDTSSNNPYNAPVIEAPSSWIVGDTVNLGYAANYYADATYNTLITTASLHSDLLDPASWTKSPYNPILGSWFFSSTYGPGSGGFFLGPDDGVWFAYGAMSNASGLTGGPSVRTVRAQKIEWDSEGRILRTIPVNATRSIPGVI
ncbi:glycoside hydrolase family 43 protein [Acidomyces richmondensis BFW]|nr:MAG: glycoside hydrolase family 43 protein [Acidomyces sp. 'richmondensis']KYG47507.1 glycoside hydrolase family 43 protein [Acidomyces richmondensis BFW]